MYGNINQNCESLPHYLAAYYQKHKQNHQKIKVVNEDSEPVYDLGEIKCAAAIEDSMIVL